MIGGADRKKYLTICFYYFLYKNGGGRVRPNNIFLDNENSIFLLPIILPILIRWVKITIFFVLRDDFYQKKFHETIQPQGDGSLDHDFTTTGTP